GRGTIVVATPSFSGGRRESRRNPRWHRQDVDDPQARVGRLPPLFTQGQSEERTAAQSRHLQVPRRRREARTRRAGFQAGVDCFFKLSGTLPPPSASLVITCSCSQMFISAEPLSAPV